MSFLPNPIIIDGRIVDVFLDWTMRPGPLPPIDIFGDENE